ncbi:PHB depolymerase family esterase [Tardiphaga sp.]|uniref:extracellular catalytic domain type 1 short-chain-length polyhydroxyalkanoate depolymerase n=1 Tax=Tardiphaga sp. TaxID=1926292 RepID=UPI00261CEEA0|nr:PHB depolymerase family esterase [Tardiphaga sp.]MDB5617053.1 esterase [Tardiphaga sp.]
MSLADNIEFLRNLPKLPKINDLVDLARVLPGGGESPIVEVTEFGSNPGDLKMFAYVPATLLPKPALVVVLHGCTQKAAGYDVGTGWSTLAEKYGFALLMPEQKSSNNGNTCFNWFSPEDTARDSGEALSIRQMIEHMADAHHIDRSRIFVTGLSAGGAMTSVMLATYPEVFAAGAIIAGLPFGIANTLQEALTGMYRAPAQAAHDLGDLVRKASKHTGPWPKVSVWHGSADRTVTSANAGEVVKQWLNVHGLPPAPMSAADVDGYPREVWWDAEGETVVESYTITGMAHGTPLAIAGEQEPYGEAGKFLLEAGIASSWHIAQFFGLTKQVAPGNTVMVRKADVPIDAIVTASTPKPRAESDGRFTPRDPPGHRVLDINAVITRALTAAGLMK